MTLLKFLFNFKNFLWLVYAGVLVVITPHTQWMFSRFEPENMHGIAWVAAIVFEAAIFAVTHLLVRHIEARRLSSFNLERSRLRAWLGWWPLFRYRWLNVYVALLVIAVMISGFANLAHAVEYGQEIAIAKTWGIPYGFFTVAFGGILPVVNLLFAAVIAKVDDSEQQTDPELDKAKAEKRDAEKRARELERQLADTERRLDESEKRYHAVGDVVVYLFGTERALGERIRYVRRTFPQLSQNGISQILGCSVSTVNEALKHYEVETIDA